MQSLRNPIDLETTFDSYRLDSVIGEGGAGRVYGGQSSDGIQVAIKLLTNSTADKRKRFRNEIAFLARRQHPNLVPVIDHGLANAGSFKGPFYVMPRFQGSLRSLMKIGFTGEQALRTFTKLLDGVEAAHLLKAIHRDLKPENVLVNGDARELAIADFGIAHFEAEDLLTAVETRDAQRLANFQYAAPEQRTPGRQVDQRADIYALGLILNELFTGEVPQGSNHARIADSDAAFAFLDPVVDAMIQQALGNRPSSVAAVKAEIEKYRADMITRQRLSAIEKTVIPEGEVDDPLAHQPPKLVGADWFAGALKRTLDRDVHEGWVRALQNMGSFSAVMGKGPHMFQFSGNTASVSAAEHEAQPIIDHFKVWLPVATLVLKQDLENQAQVAARRRSEELRRARQEEELRLRVNTSLRI